MDSTLSYVEAERAVVGGVLRRPQQLKPIGDTLTREDFESIALGAVYETIQRLHHGGHSGDLAMVITELRSAGQLEAVGGEQQLHQLASKAPLTDIEYYATKVREGAVLRSTREFHQRQLEQINAGGVEPVDLLESGLDELTALARRDSTSTGPVVAGDLMSMTIDSIEAAANTPDGALLGVPSGLPELDRFTQGFQPGQMIVVAARPGVGKSTLGMDFVRHAAIAKGIPAAVFSLEMSDLEIMQRVISAEARVALTNIRSGDVSSGEWDRLAQKMPHIQSAPLFVDTTASATVGYIRSKARAIQRQHGLGLIMIDYLQLMSSGKRVESRQVEVSEFSRAIKLLAKELEVPVVVMSQINRQSESRQDGLPRVADLRESGSIEQDADMVILIHRPEQHDSDTTRIGEADLIVAKNRSGQTGTAPVAFQGHYSRFAPLSHQADPYAR